MSSASTNRGLGTRTTALRSVTIVVPCYNEARRLNLDAFRRFATDHPEIDFIFVNDGSKDETLPLLQTFCRRVPDRFSVIDLEVNRGKAEAVRQGILAALRTNPAVVGFWDADLATPLVAIPDLVRELESRASAEIVIGARVRLMGRTIHRRAVRHYTGRLFATTVSLVLGIAVYDTQCGAKVFRTTPRTGELFGAPFLSRWIFDVELIARWLGGLDPSQRAAADTLLVEYPLMEWQDVRGSKLTPVDFFVAALELARIGHRYRQSRRSAA